MYYVAPTNRLHEPGETVLCVGGDEQMQVIGHQGIGMNAARVALTGGLQAVEKEPVVVVMKENGIAVITALNEMVRLSGKQNAG